MLTCLQHFLLTKLPRLFSSHDCPSRQVWLWHLSWRQTRKNYLLMYFPSNSISLPFIFCLNFVSTISIFIFTLYFKRISESCFSFHRIQLKRIKHIVLFRDEKSFTTLQVTLLHLLFQFQFCKLLEVSINIQHLKLFKVL